MEGGQNVTEQNYDVQNNNDQKKTRKNKDG